MKKTTLSLAQIGWVILTLILTVAWSEKALILLVFLVILGPLLRELNIIKGIDERERVIDYQSSHYAFILLYILFICIFAHSLFIKKENPEVTWYLILLAPVMVRSIFYMSMKEGARKLGLGLGFTFGIVWFTFTILSHGISLETLRESLVGGSILIATIVALKWPRIGGFFLILIVLFFSMFFKWKGSQQVLMFMLVPLPPFLAGLALYISTKRKKDMDDFSDMKS